MSTMTALEGRYAALCGLGADDCPYTRPPYWPEWIRGWADGRAIMRGESSPTYLAKLRDDLGHYLDQIDEKERR